VKKLKNFLALVIATSVFIGFGSVPVFASDAKTILSLTGKSGVNLNKSLGRVQITHPSSVICTGIAGTSTACVFNVSVQIDNASILPLQIDLVTGAGTKVGSFTLSSSVVNTVYANASSNMAVYFVVPSSNPTILATREVVQPINLQISGTPTPFSLVTNFSEQVLNKELNQVTALSKLTFAQYVFPVEMYSSTECLKFPVYVGAVDFLTGQPASPTMKRDIDFEMSVRDSSGFLSGTTTLSDRNQTWSSSNASVIEFEVCRINAKSGETTNIVLEGKGTLRLNGNTITVPFTSDIYIEGTANFINIACVKGTTAIVVSARNPACPKGYKKANIVIKNGKLQKSTIRCVKGLSVRKVTAIVPVCPSGFRRG
jgi:hypothetical protein